MSYTVYRNDIFITDRLYFYIICFICAFITIPVFELVETIACMFHVVQESMRTWERSFVACRPNDFTVIQSLLYQRSNKFHLGRIPTVATDEYQGGMIFRHILKRIIGQSSKTSDGTNCVQYRSNGMHFVLDFTARYHSYMKSRREGRPSQSAYSLSKMNNTVCFICPYVFFTITSLQVCR